MNQKHSSPGPPCFGPVLCNFLYVCIESNVHKFSIFPHQVVGMMCIPKKKKKRVGMPSLEKKNVSEILLTHRKFKIINRLANFKIIFVERARRTTRKKKWKNYTRLTLETLWNFKFSKGVQVQKERSIF